MRAEAALARELEAGAVKPRDEFDVRAQVAHQAQREDEAVELLELARDSPGTD